MAGVQRGGHRRAQVDIPQPQHQVFGVKDGVEDVVDRVQAVDPADELDVPGAPGGIITDTGHVAFDRLAGGGIVPGQRQPDGAAGNHQFGTGGQRGLDFLDQVEQPGGGQDRWVHLDLQRPDSRGEVNDAWHAELLDVLVQGVHPGAQTKVQHHLAVFHQQVVVAGAAVGDRGPAGTFRHPAQHAVVAIAAEAAVGRRGCHRRA